MRTRKTRKMTGGGKFCAACGNKSAKNNPPACKKCGEVEWVAKKPTPAQMEDEEERLQEVLKINKRLTRNAKVLTKNVLSQREKKEANDLGYSLKEYKTFQQEKSAAQELISRIENMSMSRDFSARGVKKRRRGTKRRKGTKRRRTRRSRK